MAEPEPADDPVSELDRIMADPKMAEELKRAEAWWKSQNDCNCAPDASGNIIHNSWAHDW